MAVLALSQGEDKVWSPDQTVNMGDIEGESRWGEATLKIPCGETMQIERVAYGDNINPTTEKSNEFTT